jgi:hypothetical protein
MPQLPTVCRTIVRRLYVYQRYYYTIISFLNLMPSHDTSTTANNRQQQQQQQQQQPEYNNL